MDGRTMKIQDELDRIFKELQEKEHILVPSREYFKYKEIGYEDISECALRIPKGNLMYIIMSKKETT